MSRQDGTANAEIKALIETWADAVRRHDLPAILRHHDDDIVMFDVPPPLQSRGLMEYKKTWDLFFGYHQPGQAFDVEELQMCVGDTSPLRSLSCVAGRPQSVARQCQVASSFG
jgi:ketosteroid isomerase-like protein